MRNAVSMYVSVHVRSAVGIHIATPRMAQHSTAQHSTAQHSTAQHSTAQHSTAQHSTAQRSTAQHSTAQHSHRILVMLYNSRWNDWKLHYKGDPQRHFRGKGHFRR
jgi:hypothetical protein